VPQFEPGIFQLFHFESTAIYRVKVAFPRDRALVGSVALMFSAVFTGVSPNPPNDITTPRYKRHRFPAEIIAHAVWLYFRLPLSLRHADDLLAERGIEVSFQTVAECAAKFGREYAHSSGGGPGEALPTSGIPTKWSLL
jgi:hypothetical protein